MILKDRAQSARAIENYMKFSLGTISLIIKSNLKFSRNFLLSNATCKHFFIAKASRHVFYHLIIA